MLARMSERSTPLSSYWPGVPNDRGVGGGLLDKRAPGLAIAVILRPGPDARRDLAERPRARWCIVRDGLHVTLTRPASHFSKNARASLRRKLATSPGHPSGGFR